MAKLSHFLDCIRTQNLIQLLAMSHSRPRKPSRSSNRSALLATPEETITATVLHVGAASVSAMICERRGKNLQIVDFLEKPVPVARDIFRHGEVLPSTVEQIVHILRDFQQTFAEYGISFDQVNRTIASNIFSEARNQELVLNRIRIACKLNLETVDDGEMTRLIYLKTRRRLADVPAMREKNTLVLHVGPGNTRALFFEKGSIVRYTSYRMGTHRTHQAIEASNSHGEQLLRLIREQTLSNITQLQFDYKDVKIESLVVIGYEIQSVVHHLIKEQGLTSSVKNMREFTKKLASWSDLELVKSLQIDYQVLEGLFPALEINLAVAEALELSQITISKSKYEQGLLQDVLISRELSDGFDDEVLRSAQIIAKRYLSDVDHGKHVEKICCHLFEQLQNLHQLDAHDLLLLRVSAILHEVGTYISQRAHQLHSEYIILHSEIFGLERLDISMIALIARYHRHGGPDLAHDAYQRLSVENRIRVSKLASLLRVADALERTHAQRIKDIQIQIEPNRLVLNLPDVTDASIESLALQSKADLFQQIFGLSVEIEEAL